jgi:thioredoxin reductase (NADPH)
MRDVVIIGGGSAGLSAAIYTCRNDLDSVLYEKAVMGGQISMTNDVENYPGFPDGISGPALTELMQKQAVKFGLDIETANVSGIEKKGDVFTVSTDNGEVECKAVILATGASPRFLGCKGEKEYGGLGVSYCATCDGPFFRNQELVVVGGGDAAVEEAHFLTRFASKVTVIHRRDKLRATPIIADRFIAHPKAEVLWDSVVDEITGDSKGVNGVNIRNVKTSETGQYPCMGVFIFIGHIPTTDIVKGMVDLDAEGHVKVDMLMRTNVPGLFACGDNRSEAMRQLACSCGDAVTAALSAYKYIEDVFPD